jgi:sortase A
MPRLRTEPASVALRWLNRALIGFGLVCVFFYGAVKAHTAIYQYHAKLQIDQLVSKTAASPTPATLTHPAIAAQPEARVRPGDLIGRVDVPRLNLSAAVAEGDDPSTLGKAVGHLPDTSLPWQPTGNVAFAAHRDGLFRALKDIRVGDDVRIVTGHGEFLYRVWRTQIVGPNDVWVIASTPRPTLTLITCYPFSFVGHAPQRFVVQAERVDADPPGVAIQGTVLQ